MRMRKGRLLLAALLYGQCLLGLVAVAAVLAKAPDGKTARLDIPAATTAVLG